MSNKVRLKMCCSMLGLLAIIATATWSAASEHFYFATVAVIGAVFYIFFVMDGDWMFD